MKSAIIHLFKNQRNKHAVKMNGPCFGNFIQSVKKNLSEEQASKTRRDSLDIVDACIGIIEKSYGKKGRQSLLGKTLLPSKNKIEPNSTVLIYGRVQSGKTNCAIGTLALALENGFKIFVLVALFETGTQGFYPGFFDFAYGFVGFGFVGFKLLEQAFNPYSF